jgi:phospholipid transport system transporter-binding protein
MSEGALLSIAPSGTARVEGALTLATVTGLYEEAAIAAREGKTMQSLDLSAVSHVDSSGLALVLEWQSEALHGGRKLPIVDAPADLLSLAKLCEASELLPMDGRDS